MIITRETIPVLSEQLPLYSRGEGQEGGECSDASPFREGSMEEVVGIRCDLARSRLVTRRDGSHKGECTVAEDKMRAERGMR